MKKKTEKNKSKNKTTPRTLVVRRSSLKISEVKHPVLLHKLSLLRDQTISSMSFRQIVEEMAQMLCYEATKDLKMELRDVTTPLEKMRAPFIAESVSLVAILRAGLGMLNGMMKILPNATVGHIGIYKDRFVQATVEYYLRLPKLTKDHTILLLDPMLATGDTACAAIDRLKEYGVRKIRMITLLAAPEGVAKVNALHPDVLLYTVSLERELNKKGYILPGMGDAGDRLFDTIQHT